MNTNWKKPFFIIYAGQAFSLLGSAAVQFAVIWWLTVQTESALVLTLSTVIAFIPNMVIGPFAGVWIDRYNRRKVMMAADGLVALSSVILGIAFLLLKTPPLWFLFFILFLRGVGNTFHGPAMQAAVPMLLPAEMLTKAGGWGNLINSISTMLGPVLGAALMGMFPIASIMLVDILGAALAIFCLLFVKIPDIPQGAEKPDFIADWKQGFVAIRENKPLVAALPAMLLCNVLYMPLGALFPLLVYSHFMGTAWHNSLVEFVFAGGLLVSSLVMGVWGGIKRRFLMVALAIGALGAASAISGLLSPVGFPFFVGCCFVMGCTGTFINVPLMAYTQETIAPEMMGKVFSLMMTGMTLAMPIGLLLAGPVSQFFGVDLWFFWSGIALAATGVLCGIMTWRYDS
ncbi:MAG: MFS transporter [Clostridiales bacterium]